MKIEHIAMYVNDIEQVRDFFIRYLDGKSNDGYYNPQTNFRSYFISFDTGARLEIMNKPDLVDEEKFLNRTGFIHIAFSVGSKERVNQLTQLLQDDGYYIVLVKDSKGHIDKYQYDPSTGEELKKITK